MQPVRSSGTRTVVAALTAVGVAAALAAGTPTTATATPAASGADRARTAVVEPAPSVRLRTLARAVEAAKYGDRVYYDLGAYLEAVGEPFEVRTRRAGYRVEPVSRLQRAAGNVRLPAELSGFGRLRDFVNVRIEDRAGRAVVRGSKDVCLNGWGAVRMHPDAPDTSNYPDGCASHPFGLGQVQGLTDGWGFSVASGGTPALGLGRYTARVAIAEPWRRVLGVRTADAVTTVRLEVVRARDCGHCFRAAHAARSAGRDRDRTLEPRAVEPTGDGQAPRSDHLPDLRSLPAFGIGVDNSGDYLVFGANVWNAGPSPLVVDGFRREGQDLMDAYQYFYTADGEPAGHARTGTMEWDDRDGHSHWHFTDFARYRLLDAEKQHVVRSKKEAFCLAATDAIDYTRPGAEWHPWNTDLHTACGGYSSAAVREVLPVGSGDTYSQYRPGQSFALAGTEPGIYFIEVTANPVGNLHETDLDNNTAYRKIRIGGRDGDHWVRVFRKGLVRFN